MTLQIIAGPLAVENLKDSEVSSWPARGKPGSRLEPFAQPALNPTFTLTPGEAVFTIGSCFARNIEAVLEELGFDIPTRAVIASDPDFGVVGHNVLNNYGMPSIFNEVSWALDPSRPFREEEAFFEVFPGKYVDAHLNHALKPTTLEVLRARRRAIIGAYKTLRDCRVVIITLGLTECWYDTRAKVYLNTSPRRSMVRQEPDRFELHVLDYEETYGYLKRTLDLIRSHGRADVRVILTVSPVPLTSTYRGIDVMIANSYSKSVLRTAAEAVTLQNDFVDYYPSYESVTLSDRARAIQDDQVHPTAEVVRLNVGRMVAAYVGTDKITVESIREQITVRPSTAVALLADRLDLLPDHPDLALALVNAAMKSKRLDVVLPALSHVGALLPEPDKDLICARVALRRREFETAAGFLSVRPKRDSSMPVYWSAVVQTRIGLGDLAGALEAANLWAELNIRTGEPFRLVATGYSMAGDMAAADSLFDHAMSLSDDDATTLLDYAEHLKRAGRRDDMVAVLGKVKPNNPAHLARLERLRVGIAVPA